MATTFTDINKQKFHTFLDNIIRNAKELPAFKCGEIEKQLEEFACEGCGRDGVCNRPFHELTRKEFNKRPEYDWYDCQDCFFCGCPKCEVDSDYYDGYDGYDGNKPTDDYSERYSEMSDMLLCAMRESSISLESWAKLLSNKFIRNHYKYQLYKDIWRERILDANNPIYCPTDVNYNSLSKDEKQFFKDPDSYNYSFYNVLRIMAGLPGLDCPIK